MVTKRKEQTTLENEKERDIYQQKVKAELDKLNAQIDELKAKANQAKAETAIQYNNYLEELYAKRDVVESKFKELQDSGEEAWSNIQTGFENAWDDLNKAFDNAFSKFQQ